MHEKCPEGSTDTGAKSEKVAFPEKITLSWVSDNVPIAWFWYSFAALFTGACLVFVAGMETKAWLLTHSAPITPQSAYVDDASGRLEACQVQYRENIKQIADANSKIAQLTDAISHPTSLKSNLDLIANQRRQIDSLQRSLTEARTDTFSRQPSGFSPFLQTTVLQRKLIHKEAERLIEIIDQLKDIARMSQQVKIPNSLVINPYTRRPNMDGFPHSIISSGADSAISQISKFKSDVAEIDEKIKSVISNNINYESEIKSIV